jgi:hypothetical protein
MDTFSYNIASYPGCYTFTTYEADQVQTPMSPPIHISIAYPAVTIPATVAGAINVPSLNYKAKINATIASQPGVVFWSTLDVTINHECSLASFVGSEASNSVTYIISSTQNP